MKKILKLLTLILLSFSVYFIYQSNKNTTIIIFNIGDGVALGLNSFKEPIYGYVDYYKDSLNTKNIYINQYAKTDLTIPYFLEELKSTPKIKKDLKESHILFLHLGYNDIVYRMSIEESLNEKTIDKILLDIEKEYEQLKKEIRKYYSNPIIVIGCLEPNKEDFYLKKAIKTWNQYLEKDKDIIYIDTFYLLKNRKKYFSNPNSYYPNFQGYQQISKKIIEKTLENQ